MKHCMAVVNQSSVERKEAMMKNHEPGGIRTYLAAVGAGIVALSMLLAG